MQIKNLRKVKNPTGRTRAFFSVETKNFIIHDCRLVQTDSGSLVGHLPFKRYISQGRKVYEPVIEFKDLDYLEVVTAEAVKAYDLL